MPPPPIQKFTCRFEVRTWTNWNIGAKSERNAQHAPRDSNAAISSDSLPVQGTCVPLLVAKRYSHSNVMKDLLSLKVPSLRWSRLSVLILSAFRRLSHLCAIVETTREHARHNKPIFLIRTRTTKRISLFQTAYSRKWTHIIGMCYGAFFLTNALFPALHCWCLMCRLTCSWTIFVSQIEWACAENSRIFELLSKHSDSLPELPTENRRAFTRKYLWEIFREYNAGAFEWFPQTSVNCVTATLRREWFFVSNLEIEDHRGALLDGFFHERTLRYECMYMCLLA